MRATMRPVMTALWLLAVMLITAVAAQGITQIPAGDPIMDAAIAKARATLPRFWAVLAEPKFGDSGFAVKIHYDLGNNNGEHIWAGDVVRQGDMVTGTINNVPCDIPNLKRGQQVTVPVAQLSDWLFTRDGKLHGGQTIRALLPRMPPVQAAELSARLAPE